MSLTFSEKTTIAEDFLSSIPAWAIPFDRICCKCRKPHPMLLPWDRPQSNIGTSYGYYVDDEASTTATCDHKGCWDCYARNSRREVLHTEEDDRPQKWLCGSCGTKSNVFGILLAGAGITAADYPWCCNIPVLDTVYDRCGEVIVSKMNRQLFESGGNNIVTGGWDEDKPTGLVTFRDWLYNHGGWVYLPEVYMHFTLHANSDKPNLSTTPTKKGDGKQGVGFELSPPVKRSPSLPVALQEEDFDSEEYPRMDTSSSDTSIASPTTNAPLGSSTGPYGEPEQYPSPEQRPQPEQYATPKQNNNTKKKKKKKKKKKHKRNGPKRFRLPPEFGQDWNPRMHRQDAARMANANANVNANAIPIARARRFPGTTTAAATAVPRIAPVNTWQTPHPHPHPPPFSISPYHATQFTLPYQQHQHHQQQQYPLSGEHHQVQQHFPQYPPLAAQQHHYYPDNHPGYSPNPPWQWRP